MNHKKIMAAAVSIAALASLAACGGVKDSGSASGDADVITVGTTDKVTSVDPAAPMTTVPMPFKSTCSRSCMRRTTTPLNCLRTSLRMTVPGVTTALSFTV